MVSSSDTLKNVPVFGSSGKLGNARALSAVLGIILIGIAAIIFDSGLTQQLGTEGNQGLVPLLSLVGSIFVLIGARLKLTREFFLWKVTLQALVLFYIFCLFISFILSVPSGLTLIAWKNLFFQISIWALFLLLISTRPKVPSIEGIASIIFVLFALFGYLLFKADIIYFNLNWLAIVFFGGSALFLVSKRNRLKTLSMFFICMFLGIITFFFFYSRGVALMFFSLGLIWILMLKAKRFTRKIVLPLFIIISMSSGLLGVFFYDTTWFNIVDQYSRAELGKALSISRFERWTKIGNEIKENKRILIHGVGPGGYSVGKYRYNLTASHNAAMDTLFFLGIIGFFTRGAILFCLYVLLINRFDPKKEAVVNAIFGSIILSSNYYGLTGFTHLGGTIPMVFVLSLMVPWVREYKTRKV